MKRHKTLIKSNKKIPNKADTLNYLDLLQENLEILKTGKNIICKDLQLSQTILELTNI